VNNLSRQKSLKNLFKKKPYYILAIVLISLVCYILEFGFDTDNKADFESAGNLAVCFIDVGQGDCTLIKTPSGKHMVIDAGTGEAKYKILDYLTNNGVREIEYCVFTHPHEDHIGSAETLIESFTVKNALLTNKSEPTATFERLVDALSNSKKEKGTKVLMPSVGETYALDENVSFTILSADGANKDTNNSSICLKLTYGNTSFLFTGDAEKIIENQILYSGADVSANVFKCAHHGSSTSNSEDFVRAVAPEIAIVSCGLDNSYGHPHREVISTMSQIGAQVYRTDNDGDIVIFSDGNSVNVNMTHKAA